MTLWRNGYRLEFSDLQWWAWLMYTPLFLLFHYFLYIAEPLLCTPMMQPPMWASTITCVKCACLHLIGPASLDGHMMYNSHVYSFPFSYLMCPPTAQPIMNHHAAQSGTYYSFTLDEPCACFLIYHLYLHDLYLSFAPENCIYEFPPVFRFSACASPCPISHHIALPHSPTVFTCYATPGDNPLPPDHTLRAS